MKLNKRALNKFMGMSFFIIVFESLNILYLSKITAIDEKLMYLFIINYLTTVFIYIIFSLYNYFLYNKVNINLLYKGTFSLFIISNIIYKFLVSIIKTPFWYLSIAFQVIILLMLIIYKERG